MTSPESLSLEIATPLGLMVRAETQSVQAPSVDGEFGLLPGHVPILAAIRSGLLKYKSEGRDHVVAVGPGFVQSDGRKVLVLTELFAEPKDVDRNEVSKELGEAEVKLKAFKDAYEGSEYSELQRDIEWAFARLDAAASLSH